MNEVEKKKTCDTNSRTARVLAVLIRDMHSILYQ